MTALPDEAHGALGVGWATVELDRAARELAHLLVPGSAFADAPSSVLLGARCRVGPAADDAVLQIVLLEPDSEGPLAATLARGGEGWAATWILTSPVSPRMADPGRSGALSTPRPGPFGPERLLLGGRRPAPHRLIVDVPSHP